MKKDIAISIGDINGIGLEILLLSHSLIESKINPIYCVDYEVLDLASRMLNLKIPNDLNLISIKNNCQFYSDLKISPSLCTKESGEYSFESFKAALNLVNESRAKGIVTLPISKSAWKKAGINFLGHTHYLNSRFNRNGIMMLGEERMFVALFSDHIPLKDVPNVIEYESLLQFLLNFKSSFDFKKAAVLGLNPHCGEDGLLGSEERVIALCIKKANEILGDEIFIGPLPPDSAFTPNNREKFSVFVAMYHDQGLIPLKALYFEKSINVTLNLPILRASVDHGVAFDIAYKKNRKLNIASYIEAINFIESY